MEFNKIYNMDCLEGMRNLPNECIDCVVTSPPYFSLRSYQTSPLVWGGDSTCEHEWKKAYASGNRRYRASASTTVGNHLKKEILQGDTLIDICEKCGAYKGELGLEPKMSLFVKHLCIIFDEVKRILKPTGTCFVNLGDTYAGSGKETSFLEKEEIPKKSLYMVPERFAIAMIDREWILRNQIIWHKPNQLPSSVTDRFTMDFEKIFFFTKNSKYYFEQQFEPHNSVHGLKFNIKGRNRRSVWSIPTMPNRYAHFAQFPPSLIEPMIKAGCPEDGVVLDPFMGGGTSAIVAKTLKRNYIGFEMNTEYCAISEKRLEETYEGLF